MSEHEQVLPQPRMRPRISLLTAFLLTTIAAMALVVAQLWREVGPLRKEVFGLKQELGYLSVKNENKIYAIRVPGLQSDVYRYRIYLPENRKFKIKTRLFNIPGIKPGQTRQEWLASLAGSGMSSTIEGGERTIDVSVVPDLEKKDQWLLKYRTIGKESGGTSGTTMPWMNDRRTWQVSGEVAPGKQSEINPDDGVVLLALRQGAIKEFEGGGYSTTGPDETKNNPGLMLWIAPAGNGG